MSFTSTFDRDINGANEESFLHFAGVQRCCFIIYEKRMEVVKQIIARRGPHNFQFQPALPCNHRREESDDLNNVEKKEEEKKR